MQTGGGLTSRNLDARLLRFRDRPEGEEGAALAEALLAAGRSVEAQEVASTALRVDPRNLRLMVLEGRAWMQCGELLQAQASLLQAARAYGADKAPFRWLGEVLLKRGDPERATKVLQRAKQLDAEDPDIDRLFSRARRLARIAEDSSQFEVDRVQGQASAPAPAAAAEDEFEGESTRSAARSSAELARHMPQPGGEAAGDDAPTDRHGMPEWRGATAPTPDLPMYDEDEDGPTELMNRPALSESPAHAGVDTARSDDGALSDMDPRATAKASPPPPAAPADPLTQSGAAPHTPIPDGIHVDPEITDPEAAPLPQPPAEQAPDEARPEADLGGGHEAGRPEDVDGLLRMLKDKGIFEPPSGEAASWAPAKESPGSGTRIGKTLTVLWLLVLLAVGGGWYGYNRWVEHRHHRAAKLIEKARAKALVGSHKALVGAERHLREARELHPRNPQGPRLLLFVHAQRALEEGTFEPGYLRPTIARARRLVLMRADVAEQAKELWEAIGSSPKSLEELRRAAGADMERVRMLLSELQEHGLVENDDDGNWRRVESAYLRAAEAVLAAAEADVEKAQRKIELALEKAGDDPRVLYVAGRLEQRLGKDDALDHLGMALDKQPRLAGAAIALAEARADQGQREEALSLLDGVLENHPRHLRASLWKAYLTADEAEPGEALAKIEQLEQRLDEGAPTDRVLAHLARARLRRREGKLKAAGTSVEHATEAGATEPRLLALVAATARALGKLQQARQTARRAVRGAPINSDFRKLYAEILIELRDGIRALQTLQPLSAEDPEVLRLSAHAALMVGTDKALDATAKEIDKFLQQHEEVSVEMRALHLRVQTRQGDPHQTLREAKKLVEEAPGVPVAAKALGEAALYAGEIGTALDALKKVRKSAPDDADGHYLLARAHRVAGHADDAERYLHKALEIQPEHTDARIALGYLLLDRGKYKEADRLYQDLAQLAGVREGSSMVLIGRVGRAEALLGLGRLEDAEVQLEAVRDKDRDAPQYRIAAARLALAQGQPGEAVKKLRPIAEDGEAAPGIIALFGEALYEAGEIEAADEQYVRTLERDGAYPEALIGRVHVHVRAEKPRDALELAQEAEQSLEHRIRPPERRAELLTLVGRAHLQTRRGEDEARKAFRKAVEIDGVPPEAWFFLGESLAGANSPEARQAYEKYLELDPDGAYADRARRAID